MTPHLDHLRGLTVYTEVGDGTEQQIELCAGARVYSFALKVVGREPVVLKLQDSQFEVREDFPLDMDISPGIAWPAYCRLVVPVGSTATLHVAYGDCA